MPEVLNYLCPYCGSEVRVGEPCPGCTKKARKKKTARKSWEADVRKQTWGELVDVSLIKANSHRDFNRQAKQQAQRNYQVLKPHLERLAAEKARLTQAATAEARVVAEQAWGKPSVQTSLHQPPATTEETQSRFDRAMRRGDMLGITKAMIDSGQI